MLPSLSVLSLGNGAIGITSTLLLISVIMTLWVLALIILHPIHALIFVISATIEYFIYNYFFFDIWQNALIFLGLYLLFFGTYSFFIQRFLPLPKDRIEQLIKLSELYEAEKINEEEYKKAKKLLLKL